MSHTLFNLPIEGREPMEHCLLPSVISLHILVSEASRWFQIPEGPVTTKQQQ